MRKPSRGHLPGGITIQTLSRYLGQSHEKTRRQVKILRQKLGGEITYEQLGLFIAERLNSNEARKSSIYDHVHI